MRLHYIQHVPFEGPAAIESWAADRGHSLDAHRLFEATDLPSFADVDGLIVMGGPMGVNDADKHPWLRAEIDYIRAYADSNKPLLGICLGAQLIAHALGAAVTRNPHTEIGWFPLRTNQSLDQHRFGNIIPDGFSVFHWHGDTFAIPQGGICLASSEACRNQAFTLNNNVLGLQFHLEATTTWAQRLISHCSDELDNSTYVQTGEQMLAQPQRFTDSNRIMTELLDVWSKPN